MYITRKKTKKIAIKDKFIGGGSPITIQSMNNTDTRDIKSTIRQIKQLEEAGCEITRLAVKDAESANALKEIKKQAKIPIAADIHFDYRLAILSIENGADKIRVNPGNIGGIEKIKKIVLKAKEYNIPIRVGVNSGSLERDLIEKYNGVTVSGLVESAMRNIELLEALDFDNIVVSLKSSSVPFSIEAYELLSNKVAYPLHVGITESGTEYSGSIKSAVGIGSLLSRGIGDTIRVSLTSDPVNEVKCAKEILKSLNIRKFGIELISCPTCGRTEIDLIRLANEVENRCKGINKPIRVAVMGCVVNGPGEAKEADIGIAGGRGVGVIIKKGEIIKKVDESGLVDGLMKEIEKF
ncbi:MAG: flavodoxin-dependent (E)-4-hydroxy-3-methylbut-2-enyl-diphosphate synthase [Clostridiales bacterium]|nr:flavodoxin-dependent (E)-4-hydroxy-3-methylbut-2-enyl-diphosphate synthase [Clostridiales bacterium]